MKNATETLVTAAQQAAVRVEDDSSHKVSDTGYKRAASNNRVDPFRRGQPLIIEWTLLEEGSL